MKVLVTGGTGFFGRHIVWHLANAGMEVVFTGRNAAAAADVIANCTGNVIWKPLHHGTPEASSAISKYAEGAFAIVHCAALSAPWGKQADFHQANVASTTEVISACKASNVARLVHISTPSVYFEFCDKFAIPEDSILPHPVNEYARSKAEAELLVSNAPIKEVVILRPRALFGPWDNTLMPRLLRAMERGPLPIMRGGQANLDLTYIDNAVEAVSLALSKPLAKPLSVYNVSNGEPMVFSELLDHIAREFPFKLRTRSLPWPFVSLLTRGMETVARLKDGFEPPLTRYSAGVLAFSQTLDISAIRNDFGYQPRVPITDGIRKYAEWWKFNHKER